MAMGRIVRKSHFLGAKLRALRKQNHMTLEYSRMLAPIIGALADRALADN